MLKILHVVECGVGIVNTYLLHTRTSWPCRNPLFSKVFHVRSRTLDHRQSSGVGFHYWNGKSHLSDGPHPGRCSAPPTDPCRRSPSVRSLRKNNSWRARPLCPDSRPLHRAKFSFVHFWRRSNKRTGSGSILEDKDLPCGIFLVSSAGKLGTLYKSNDG